MKRRIVISIVCIILYRIVMIIPAFGIDPLVYADISDSYILRLKSYNLSVGMLGIRSYISASFILLLLSGPLKKLRKIRDGSAKEKQLFDRIIIIITVLISSVIPQKS